MCVLVHSEVGHNFEGCGRQLSNIGRLEMLSGYQRVQLAAQIQRSPKTVERVYKGGGNAFSREAVTRGARALGLPLPPEPAPAPSPPRAA
jgi:hypothetical protein